MTEPPSGKCPVQFLEPHQAALAILKKAVSDFRFIVAAA